MRWEDVRDWVFPMVELLSARDQEAHADREKKCLEEAASHADPAKVVGAYEKMLEAENDRLKSVEGRLGAVLGLSSITASLLVGGTMALVNGSLSDSPRIVRWIGSFGLLYLSAQIICSTLAGVRGLRRSAWLRPGIEDLVSDATITSERARSTCERYQQTELNVNSKVTQMAVAHTAIRNFAVGSAAIAVLGFAAVLFQTPGSAAAEAIRKDVELQRLLRGPQGSPGPPGPPAAAAPAQSPRPADGTQGRPHRRKIGSKAHESTAKALTR